MAFTEEFFKYFARVLMLLLVLPLREAAVGLVAKWQGDDTAEREGRITLNPFVHLDFIGSLLILLIGFGWGKPLPVNPNRMKNYRRGMLLTSLAGPVTNFLAAFICCLINSLMLCSESVLESLASSSVTPVSCIQIVLSFLFQINVCLGVISILPIPPMEGFNILRCFAGNKFERWYFTNQRNINIAAMLILLILFTLPDAINPLIYLIVKAENLISLTTSWIPALRWS